MDPTGPALTLVLPPLLLAALVLAAATRSGWRDALLHGFLALGAFWIVGAALVSTWDGFDAPGVALTHVVTIAAAAAVAWRGRAALPPLPRPRWDPWLAALGAELVLLLVIAVSVAPNNFDSMAYHLPKIEQWIQQGHVGAFPAHFLPQVYLAPLAEIGMAEVKLMVGTYWAVNLVQLLAHVVTLVGVSVIARNVGLDRRGQAVAAGVFGLAPLAVAEAVTTQNDYVVTAFVVAAYAVSSRPADLPRPHLVALTGLAAGLAVATKPTALVLVWPAALWALRHLRGAPLPRRLLAVAAGVLAAVAVNLTWTTSNLSLFDSPTGPDVGLVNASHGPSTIVGNAIRNTGYQLGTPVGRVNDVVAHVVGGAMGAVGIDPDDPATNFQGVAWSVDSERNEDRPANLLQGLLVAAALVFTLLVARLRRQVGWLAASILVSYLLFGAVFRWQPWGGRLLMPLLALGAVVVAAWLSSWRWRWSGALALLVLAALVAQSLPWLLASQWRPLVGSASVLRTSPEDEWFRAQPQLKATYLACRDVADRAAGPVQVGLDEGVYAWEYPIWALLRGDGQDTLIANLGVQNATRSVGSGDGPVEIGRVSLRAIPPIDRSTLIVFSGGVDDETGVLSFACGGDDTTSP